MSAFKAMNTVVEASFSTKIVSDNIDKKIAALRIALEAVGVSETLKIHVCLEHLRHSLHFLKNDSVIPGGFGLGLWSEIELLFFLSLCYVGFSVVSHLL